jgi:hypothetical protein
LVPGGAFDCGASVASTWASTSLLSQPRAMSYILTQIRRNEQD